MLQQLSAGWPLPAQRRHGRLALEYGTELLSALSWGYRLVWLFTEAEEQKDLTGPEAQGYADQYVADRWDPVVEESREKEASTS